MAAPSQTLAAPSAPRSQAISAYPPSSLLFDYCAAGLSLWFLFGLFLDGWAHNHGRVDDTFFTPWHLVLYSGYGVVGLLLVATHIRNIARGYSFTRALPKGYWLSLVGILIFGMSGGADFVWHTLFGIEANIEALLSPSHLALATGGFLFVTGPIRAAYYRHQQDSSWYAMLPLIIALLGVTSLLTFFTQYASLEGNLWGLTGYRPGNVGYLDLQGTVSFLIYPAILLAMTLIVSRRWRLPMGAFALLYGINMLLMTWLTVRHSAQYLLVLPALAVGLLVDVLLKRWQPLTEHPMQLRGLSFIMPFALSLTYLGGLHLIGMAFNRYGLWWKVHMWLGVPFTAGIAGYLLSFLVVPPVIAQDEEE